MVRINIQYYRVKKGRGYWEPSKEMKLAGMEPLKCGADGPAAWKLAEAQNAAWKAIQNSTPEASSNWPPGSIGEALSRYKTTEEWTRKAQRTRQDWLWAWDRIGPIFGDQRPDAIGFEEISAFRVAIRDRIGAHEAHRCIKIWRALWRISTALGYATKADPSQAIRNTAPPPRQWVWTEGEIVRIVKHAWRSGYRGLAVAVAIAWDTQFSPVDVRTLTLSERQGDAFHRERAKTGRAAIGTLSRRTLELMDAYLADCDYLPSVPFLRTRNGAIYQADILGKDFRKMRQQLFGMADSRALIDIRRSGAVEAIRGGASAESLATKMANDLSASNALHRAYVPVDLETVKRADQARRKGRRT